MADALIATGTFANIVSQRSRGWSPIMEASDYGHSRIVESLIAARASVNQAPNQDQLPSAICMASCNGHSSIVGALIAAGAPVDDTTKSGWSLIMGATEHGHAHIVDMRSCAQPCTLSTCLIAAGTSVNCMTTSGQSPVTLASHPDPGMLARLAFQANRGESQGDSSPSTLPAYSQWS